jgi:hypothetical protein
MIVLTRYKQPQVEISTFREASRITENDRDAAGVGGTAWYRGRGNIGPAHILVDGIVVAYVSYNGRVWWAVSGPQVEVADLDAMPSAARVAS